MVAALAIHQTSRRVAPGQSESPPFASPVAVAGDPLTQGEQARQNGEVGAAADIYRSLLQHSDAALVEEARARLAGLELTRGRHAEAAALMEPLAASSDPTLRGRALFVLGEAARGRKDCPTAIGHYQALVSAGALLEPYARLGLIQCAEAAGDVSTMAQQAQELLERAPHRRFRIEVLEKLAAAELQGGNARRYFEIYDELYALGATRSYRGSVLFSTAQAARNVGLRDLAVTKLSALIREYPEHPRALNALDTLNALQESSSVTWTQAALVRLNARQEEAARLGFDMALAEDPDGPEAAVARYQRAALMLKHGRETEAAREMKAAAEQRPDSAIAPLALLRAGRIIESNDDLDEAREIYGRLASLYSDWSQGRTGRFRLGLLQYLRGDRAGAIAVWEPLAQDRADRDLQTLALQWQGKAYRELGSDEEGDARLRRAAEIGPDTFGGLRAMAIERGDSRTRHVFQALTDLPRAQGVSDPDLDAWLASQGTSQAELQATLTVEPMYLRAAELTRLGMRNQAGWELDGLAEKASQQDAPAAHLYFLAATEMSLGYSSLAVQTAETAVRQLKLARTSLPKSFQRMVMPLAFEAEITAGANRQQTDPLLLAAIVRQESRFDPGAKSVANALGLSQIVPSTGRAIATALGYQGFSEADLFKPSVNLEFGAYFLSQQLNRYDGLILPALAAYNAGAGVVEKWLNQYGRADMDLFTARIPYNETSTYVHVVYENYELYRRLYRD